MKPVTAATRQSEPARAMALKQRRADATALTVAVSAGTVPCDGACPEPQIELFPRWIDAGKLS
ncbi:MAG TPA: hypothetical protein VLX59_10535 [Acidimicrobiales bacterium]|nr:hypothetical protein [Acidimicrobiales bacterium]